MAINERVITPTIYGGIQLYNPQSKIDKTSLTFSMWESTLKVSIVPIIKTENANDPIKYDYHNAISIYLTPIKAHLFAEILRKFKENPDQYNNYGIDTPQSIITIDKPDTFGVPNGGPVITIRRVNENGNVEASYAYECSTNNFGSIVGFNVSNPKNFKKNTEIFKDAEIDAIITQLDSYYQAMTNTIAFSVTKAMYPFMDKIAAKMGVELLNGRNGANRGPGFFASNSLAAPPTLEQMTNQSPNIQPDMMYNGDQFKNFINS